MRPSHANDAIARTADLRRLSHLAGRALVTLDMDGTCYDPWACCGIRGNFRASDSCTHLRYDIVEHALELAAGTDAALVVLSWRAGLVDTTIGWLAACNIAVAGVTDHELDAPRATIEAVFIPGSADDVSSLAIARDRDGRVDHAANRATFGSGQVAFKAGTLTVLRERLGCTLHASFDDNVQVVDAFADLGVVHPVRAQHLVKIAPHEWAAGYLGAPEPARRTVPYTDTGAYTSRLFDDVHALNLDIPDACEACEVDPAGENGLCPACNASYTAALDDAPLPAGELVTIVGSDDLHAVVQYDEDDVVVRNLTDGELSWVDAADCTREF